MITEENHDSTISIFETSPSNTTTQSREWVEFHPVNQITEYAALEFNIPPQTSGYMDLGKSVLKLKFRLTNDANNPVTEQDLVGIVNLALHSIFSQVDCSLQQVSVSQVGTNYPYKAFIDTLLTSGSGDGIRLESQMFFKDDNDPNSADPNGANSGLFTRFTCTRNGNIVDLEGPLCLDLFQQERLIVNGVSLSLKLWPSKNAFRLMSNVENPSYKVEIVDSSFKLCVQRINPAILMAHSKLIKESPAIYPYTASSIKIASIAKGEYSYFNSGDNFFNGSVPSQLILGLVSSTAYSGDYKRSPFYFQHFNCNFVGFYVDGQTFPTKPLQPNFETGNVTEAYRTLEIYQPDIAISRLNYRRGYTLYALDIIPHADFNTKRRGHCRLEIRFASPLTESVTLIMYAKFPQILNIDESRSVILQ